MKSEKRPRNSGEVSRRRRNRCGILCSLFLCVISFRLAAAHPPIAETVLHPRTPAEAWNVLRLVSDNVKQLLREHRVTEIADQVSLCSPALRVLMPASPAGASKPLAEECVRASLAVNSVAQSAQAGDEATATRAFDELQAQLHPMAAAFDPDTTKAEIFFCPMHPDCLSTDPAARCPKCGMNLALRHIPYSFVYMPPGEPSLRLTVSSAEKIEKGKATRVTVHLAHPDGTPAPADELLVVHTQPVHLLIIDPALIDYHHEHPVAGPAPGDYTFSFTPAASSSYRIYADVVPAATGIQEYPFTDLTGRAETVKPFSSGRPALFQGRQSPLPVGDRRSSAAAP